MTLQLTLAHIVLNVTDIVRSRAFYEKVLVGLKAFDESDNHVGYSNGSFSFWLADANMDGAKYEGVATDKVVGLHHFAFKAETMDELKEWENHLRQQGIAMSKDGITSDDFGGQGIFFRDPDNIRLEIHLG